MMRRHAIGGIVGGVLMLLLAGGAGADWSWAAEGKAPPKAVPKTGAGAVNEGAVMVPPPAVAPAAPQTAVVKPAAPQTAVVKPAAPQTAVVKPAAPQTAVVTPAAPQTAVVMPAAPQTYSYNPAGKSDPFLPFVEIDLAVKKEKEKKAREAELKKQAAGAKRPISPLQQAELKQFRLVGIAGDEQRRMAVVEDSVAKKYYPLFVGTHIGPNGGRIVSIQPDRMIVEEPLSEQSEQTEKGKKAQTRRIPVMLHKEEEGKP